jgi:hypothetical protein
MTYHVTRRHERQDVNDVATAPRQHLEGLGAEAQGKNSSPYSERARSTGIARRLLKRATRGLMAVAVEHALLLVCGAGFVGAGGVLLAAAGPSELWVLRWYYPLYTWAWTAVSAVALVTLAILNPLRYRLSAYRIAAAAVVFFAVPPFQSTFNSVKQSLPYFVPFSWDSEFAAADRAIHGGRDPWQLIRLLVEDPKVVQTLDLAYSFWFVALLLFLVWSAWSVHPRLRMQALITAMLVWVVCGTALAFVFSSAGPCYFSQVVTGNYSHTFDELIGILDAHRAAGVPLLARSNHLGIWEHYHNRIWLPFGGISAMPSVHVAMATLFALVGWRRHPLAGMLLALYALAIQLGSVALGWHYAVDGYVGGTVTLVLWHLVGHLKTVRRLPMIRD